MLEHKQRMNTPMGLHPPVRRPLFMEEVEQEGLEKGENVAPKSQSTEQTSTKGILGGKELDLVGTQPYMEGLVRYIESPILLPSREEVEHISRQVARLGLKIKELRKKGMATLHQNTPCRDIGQGGGI